MDETTEEQLDTGSSESETIETVDDETTDDSQDTPEEKARKNKSNWKKVSEKAKLAEKLERELETAKTELEEWRNLNPDIAVSKSETKRLEAMETRLFFAENLEAKAQKDRLETMIAKSKWALSLDEAWDIIKDTLPKESVSKTDFTTKSAPVTNKKDVTKLSPEDALKLSGSDYNKWAKANWYS